MNLIARIMRAMGWPPTSVRVPKVRRPVVLCGRCGRMFAASATGLPWRHVCRPAGGADAA